MSLLDYYGAYNGSWLMQQDFPPLQYAVDGLIPEGLTYVVAAPKIGKSWFVLDLAASMSEGMPFLGAIPVDSRPVLYLALEDGPRRTQSRLRNLGIRDLGDNITFVHMVDAEKALPLIAEFMAAHHGQKPVVILDVLGKIKPDKGGNTGAYEHDYRVSGGLKGLADEYEGFVIVVHHNRKASSDDFLEDVSGTQGIAGAADTIIVIRRARTDVEGEMHVTGREVHEGAYMVRFQGGKWTLAGGSLAAASAAFLDGEEKNTLGDQQSAVLDYVNSQSGIVTAETVAAALSDKLTGDDKTKRAGTYLGRLVDAGKIKRPVRGKYQRKETTSIPLDPVESVESVESRTFPQVSIPASIPLDFPPAVESVENEREGGK